jgi:choice-of-anchor A domain-containing protein
MVRSAATTWSLYLTEFSLSSKGVNTMKWNSFSSAVLCIVGAMSQLSYADVVVPEAPNAASFSYIWNQLKPLVTASVISTGPIEAVCSDFQGPLVSWNNIKLSHFQVNGSESLLADNSAVVAGGEFILRDGSVDYGHVVAYRGITLHNYVVGGKLYSTKFDTQLGLDDGAQYLPAQDMLKEGTLYRAFTYALSKPFKNLEAKKLDLNADGELVFGADSSGCACHSVLVYAVESSVLSAAKAIRFVNAGGAKIVIRILGTSVSFADRGEVTLPSCVAAEDVLWVAEDALDVDFNHVVLPGTLFAPGAKIEFYMGRLEGALVAREVDGNIHRRTFDRAMTCGPGDDAAQINFHPFHLNGVH